MEKIYFESNTIKHGTLTTVVKVIRTAVYHYRGHKFRVTYNDGNFKVECLNTERNGWNLFATAEHVGFDFMSEGKTLQEIKLNECEKLFDLTEKYLTAVFG